jgi:hypothetical protein
MKTLLFLLLLVAVAVLAFLALRPESNLANVFNTRRLTMPVRSMGETDLTEADIMHLPEPVQRYLNVVGAIGKPPISSVHVTFNTTLYASAGGAGMTGLAHQIDVLDPPGRLFFMETRMSGLQVAVLHDYSGSTATMRVRLMRLYDVVNASGPELSKTETVTLLNDICAYAPSALIGPAFQWTPVSDTETDVTYTNGPHQVHARLFFDADGHLVDFRSEDRGDISGDGKLKFMPWTTPLGNFKSFQGRLVPGYGEAIWHKPEGPFTYGRFEVLDVIYNTPQSQISIMAQ